MVQRLALVNNIGNFDQVASGAQLPLSRFNVVYAENGRGKTTISAILRSLSTGDPTHILERHRLGAQNPPHVVVDFANGTSYTFQNGVWSQNADVLTIFDDSFISANVCSGLEIAADHRRNMHELILGAQGVTLNAVLQTVVAKIEEHNRLLREKSDAIPSDVMGGLTADQFCALAQDPDAVTKLQDAERQLAAAKASTQVKNQPLFSAVQLPAFDINAIDGVLGRTIGDLDAEAAKQVQAHVAGLGPHMGAWVATGVEHIKSDDHDVEHCPFCTQRLDGIELIDHYRAYFSDAYKKLRQDIENARSSNRAQHGGDVPAAFERSVRVLGEQRQFWSSFAEMPDVNIDTAQVVRLWRAARDAIDVALAGKEATPLEASKLPDDAVLAIGAFIEARARVLASAKAFQHLNPALELVKEKAAASDGAALASDIVRLKATIARHDPKIDGHCKAYLDEKQAKALTEQRRTKAREALDNYRQNIFPAYETSINAYLQHFNAGFRMQGMSSVNDRGGSSVKYSVLINQTDVPLVADGAPSFRTALSSGDRNTLALAFFFASLEHDANIANRVVVIDDPMTSLDEHRSLVTVQQLKSLETKVAQLIVLSHSKLFLFALWNHKPRTPPRTSLKLVRTANGSDILAWDVDADQLPEYDRRYLRVFNYVQAANPSEERLVAIDLRPMLEQYARIAYPLEFKPGDMLGAFCDKCKSRLGKTDEVLNQKDTKELRELLDYANRFHHDSNSSADTEIINDQQLAAYAQRTLTFISR